MVGDGTVDFESAKIEEIEQGVIGLVRNDGLQCGQFIVDVVDGSVPEQIQFILPCGGSRTSICRDNGTKVQTKFFF